MVCVCALFVCLVILPFAEEWEGFSWGLLVAHQKQTQEVGT